MSKPNVVTRKKDCRIIFGALIGEQETQHTFYPASLFPEQVLPTNKDVVERMLAEKSFLQRSTALTIAKELTDRWVWCNVYHISTERVCTKIQELVNNFSR